MARLVTGRDKVISRYRSYHGNTGAAIVATGDWRRVPNEYARGHVHVFGPYLYRSEFWADSPEQECRARAAPPGAGHPGRRRRLGSRRSCWRPSPARPASWSRRPGYLAGVRAICDRYDILLILDEVMAGFGRTGQWLALDEFDVRPDLITFAKGVNSGYVPIGGVIISDQIAHAFDERVFPGGLDLLRAPVGRGQHRRRADRDG